MRVEMSVSMGVVGDEADVVAIVSDWGDWGYDDTCSGGDKGRLTRFDRGLDFLAFEELVGTDLAVDLTTGIVRFSSI